MATAGDVVRDFCAAIDRKDLAKVQSLLDQEVVYHNVGSEPAVGRETSLAAVEFQFDMSTRSPSAFGISPRTETPSSPSGSTR